jgi:hypothetical protein
MNPCTLGNVQKVQISDKLWVANMVGQTGVGLGKDGRPPIRYSALADCMKEVSYLAEGIDAEIHAPKFGAGLAQGDFGFIEKLIEEIWIDNGIDVTIYSLEEEVYVPDSDDPYNLF